MTRGGTGRRPSRSRPKRPGRRAASHRCETASSAARRAGSGRARRRPDPSPDHRSPPTTTGSDDDLVEVQGSRPSEPLLVRRGWLRDHLAKQPPQPKRTATAGATAVRSLRPAHRGATRPRVTTSPPTPTDRAPSSPRWSAPATAVAASPAAASPPGSATSTTCGPGRSAAPPQPTCSPSADATTASSNAPAGDCAWPPTAPPPGPTPPGAPAPPRHSTLCTRWSSSPTRLPRRRFLTPHQ